MRKLDNRGLSLVELVISIAMATIVVGAAAMFLYNAERTYRTAEYSVDLQMEAQLLMEQMSNWVLESNHMSYGGASGSNYLVLYQISRDQKDATTFDSVYVAAKRKIIYMYQNKLYVKMDTESAANEFIEEIKDPTKFNTGFLTTAPEEKNCIGEYVKSFTLEIPSGVDESRLNSININIGMQEGVTGQSQSYTVTNQFSIRNGLYVPPEEE